VGYDRTVKVWDASTSTCVETFAISDNIFSLDWSSDGKELAWMNKNKHTELNICDPRANENAVHTTLQAFSKKTAKLFFVPSKGWIGATGFENNGRKRYIKLWDRKNMAKPISETELDAESSVLMPWFDEDLNLLYVYGKGSGALNWYEVGQGGKDLAALGADRQSTPAKGGCFVPKRAMDTSCCEVARFMKLEVVNSKLAIKPFRIRVPRKSTLYQPDIYPDTYAGKDLVDGTAWCGGANTELPLKTRTMDPSMGSQDDEEFVLEKKMTYAELLDENRMLKARVKELEEKYEPKKEEEEEK